MNDYHDYVIKDGQFIGKFEEMYRDCGDPWDASKEVYGLSLCSLATKRLTRSLQPVRLVSLGSGTGRHLEWLECPATGVELSPTAVRTAKIYFPRAEYYSCTIREFLEHAIPYDVYLFREVLWYILPDWQAIVDILKTKHGAMVIVELSFYDNQTYGRDYFDGPDDFIAKWPFTIEKIVREHTTKQQREGRVMIAGRVS